MTERHPLDDLLNEWGKSPVASGPDKHAADSVDVCRDMVAKIEAAGLQDAATWAKWMVWWYVLAAKRANRHADDLRKITQETKR